jgi:alpha-1,2-mannosyltransferase
MHQAPADAVSSPRFVRTAAALAIATAVGIFAFALAAGIGGSVALAFPLAALPAAVTAVLAWRRFPGSLSEAASWRPLAVVSLLSAVVALVQLARLAGFMVDPGRPSLSMHPSSDWMVHHSCLSAYHVANQALQEGKNIYDERLYSLPPARPGAAGANRWLGSFRIDRYEYPPPFLLVPRALDLVAPDFLRLRMIWFGLEGAVVLLAFLMVSAHVAGIAGGRALLLAPLAWAAPPTATAFQIGNVQLPVIALSLVAMVLFERRRFALGGTLLAYVTLSKLFPGLLLVYLTVRRQWRALFWTAAMGTTLLLATLALVGWAPFVSFAGHLPGLLSGEAFPGLRRPAAIAMNHSLPGLVFKLAQAGVWDLSFGASKVVGWLSTALAAGVASALASRPATGVEKPIVWLTILILATLRSPFLPQLYAVFPGLWLLGWLFAITTPTLRNLGLVLLAWAAFNIAVPIDAPMPLGRRLLVTAISQCALLAVTASALLLLRRRRRASPGLTCS